MPRSSANNALGDWVVCETDMGPVPRGTPGLCMKDCMNVTDDSGIDCLLFWPNHDVDKGKQDGNVWMLGQSSKCKIVRGPKWQTWPGGTKGKEMAEKVLDSILPLEVFPKFLGTICYDLSHDSETPIEHACITVAPVLPPFMRPGLARYGETVVHIYKTQCRIMPNYSSEKGPVVDTGAQRGAAKHPSEIVTYTGNSHNIIGALGDAKILPGIVMGCETIDANGRLFTLLVPDESVSDPNLTDSLIPVGRLKEAGFQVSFRIPVEAHLDGVDLTVYPKYGGKIITPNPDSRTIFMEYEDATWRLPKPTIALKRVLPTSLSIMLP
jgi:hypothetical protein